MSAVEACRPPRTTFLGPVRSASAVSRARKRGRLRASVTSSGQRYVVELLGSMPGGIISAAIIGFGMYQAWNMTAAPVLVFEGPFKVGGASAS